MLKKKKKKNRNVSIGGLWLYAILLYEFLLGKEKEEKHNTCLGSVAFIGYGFVIFDLGGWFYGFWGVGQ